MPKVAPSRRRRESVSRIGCWTALPAPSAYPAGGAWFFGQQPEISGRDSYICRMALREGRVFEQRLQFIAEQLADALARSVMIDDAALRPLAVSAQTGLLDASRVEAVLQRRTSERHRRVLAQPRDLHAREPGSLPATRAPRPPPPCPPPAPRHKPLRFPWPTC